MEDYLVRAIAKNERVRGLVCVTTNLVAESCRHHRTSPTATVALGRALTAGALMGALLKTRQRVALKFEGTGPLKKILVEAESNGAVRGYVGVPDVDLPLKEGKFDVAGALGSAGLLTVTKDLRLKEPYRGVVQLYTSEIAEDIAYYLTESEQIPSAVGLGVYIDLPETVSAAGGFLIQSLPPSDEKVIDRLIRGIERMPPITQLFKHGSTPEDVLQQLFAQVPFDILEKRSLAFQCSCSKGRVESALVALGKKEIVQIIEGEEQIEVTCEFCRQKYVFRREELERLIAEIH